MMFDNEFRPRNVLEYPPNNKQTFEEYFHDFYFSLNIVDANRIYIPIFWTNYYISKKFGLSDLSRLQSVLDSLDRTKRYFTIVQYDDNILNNLDGLDILIFAQGGNGKNKNISYPISLNCQIDYDPNTQKNIFASFIGKATHPIRGKISNLLKGKKEYILSQRVSHKDYLNTMKKSLFTLCPRGYGPTSFRICESLACGSIPVYIYDDAFIPFEQEFNFESVGILIHESELNNLDNILKNKNKEDINNYTESGKYIYKKYFQYDGMANTILEILNRR